jgi:hypothetical protein
MKTLLALFLFLALAENSFAQKLVNIDTLCDHRNLKQKDMRKLVNGEMLLHCRCPSLWSPEDYFIIRQPDNRYFLINNKGLPMRRSRIFSPSNMGLEYIYINEGSAHWKYDRPTNAWGDRDQPFHSDD